MVYVLPRQPAHVLLTDVEVEEFRTLAREHAGAELTADEARTVVDQLLRVLSIVRDIALRGSSDSASSVDGRPLPESGIRAITTSSPT
jgi:hypothetical protein